MVAERTYLSKDEAAAFQLKLRQLEQRKPALALKLQEAREQGDLKENADYHDAKEKLGYIEGQIQDIVATLQTATIVEYTGPTDTVRLGATVIIQEVGTDENEEYTIVGSAEANRNQRNISLKSPVGAALLGKKAGARVKVNTPGGIVKFKIVDVR